MARRVIHETRSSGSGGFGILGVIIGALIIVGAIFFFAGGQNMFARNGGAGSGPSVTVNTPAAPSAPSTSSTPSAPRAPAPTTGSGTTR